MSKFFRTVYHGDTSPGKTAPHIFTQQQTATVLGGYGEYQRIPDLQIVVGRKIHRCLQRRPSRIGNVETIRPPQDGLTRGRVIPTRLTNCGVTNNAPLRG